MYIDLPLLAVNYNTSTTYTNILPSNQPHLNPPIYHIEPNIQLNPLTKKGYLREYNGHCTILYIYVWYIEI